MKPKTLLICLIAALSLSACANTFHGAGKDMEKAGQQIQKTF